MAMNYAWQERKKFAIPVAAGGLFLVIWYFFILSGFNKDAEGYLSQRKTEESRLRNRLQAGAPREEDVQKSERDQKRLQEDLKAAREELEFRPEEAFRVKEGQNTREKMGRQRQEVFTRIESRAKMIGFPSVDSKLGFPQSFADLSEPVLAEWLLRLAMVQRIYMLAMDCGVSSLTLVEVVPGDMQDEPLVPADRFLGVLTVKVKVQGTSEQVIKLCHGLQQKGPQYLALEGVEVTSPSTTQNLLTGVITVGALVVRPEGSITPEAKH